MEERRLPGHYSLMLFVEEEKRNYLEERAFRNAERVKNFTKKVIHSAWNENYIRLLVCSSALVGANYIEANEFYYEYDFIIKMRMVRMEVKKTKYWLRLLDLEIQPEMEEERLVRIRECDELVRIFSSILDAHVINHRRKKNGNRNLMFRKSA